MSNIMYKFSIFNFQFSKRLRDRYWYINFPISLMSGFTLIELLVVMMIIAVLVSLSGFGIQNARESARDSERKSDLEAIRSALEIYRSDCNQYPVGTGDFYTLYGTSFEDSDGSSCGTGTNTYLSEVPQDPLGANEYYYNSTGPTYELCVLLEGGGTCTGSCCSISCGSSVCNFRTANP